MWWDGERCRRRLAVLPSNVFDYSIMGNGQASVAFFHERTHYDTHYDNAQHDQLDQPHATVR